MRWRLVGADVERRVGRAEEGERRREEAREAGAAAQRAERVRSGASKGRTWAGEWSEQAKGQRERVQVDAVATAGNKAAVWARCAGARSRGKKGTTNQRSQPRLWTRAWYEARRQLGRQKEAPICRVLCLCLLFERRGSVRSGGNGVHVPVRGWMDGRTYLSLLCSSLLCSYPQASDTRPASRIESSCPASRPGP